MLNANTITPPDSKMTRREMLNDSLTKTKTSFFPGRREARKPRTGWLPGRVGVLTMTIGKFNFAPRTQTLYPDAGIQKKMRLTQESEIVTTGCHGRQKIATRAGLVVTKEVLPGAEERGEGHSLL